MSRIPAEPTCRIHVSDRVVVGIYRGEKENMKHRDILPALLASMAMLIGCGAGDRLSVAAERPCRSQSPTNGKASSCRWSCRSEATHPIGGPQPVACGQAGAASPRTITASQIAVTAARGAACGAAGTTVRTPSSERRCTRLR